MDIKTHPDESAYLAFASTVQTEEYMKLLAAYIKNKYPDSADRVLPKLREVYKIKFKGGK